MNTEDNGFFLSGDWDLPMMDTTGDANDNFLLESWQIDQDPSSNSSGTTLSDEDEDDLIMFDIDNVVHGGFGQDHNDYEDAPPTPPAGRLLLEEALEETLAAAVSVDDHEDDEDSFFTTQSGGSGNDHYRMDNSSCTSFLPIEQRYQASLEKLTQSMKKSQETRKSLRMKTSETAEYERWNSVTGTLSSIEKSTQQLQQYLKNKKPAPQAVL